MDAKTITELRRQQNLSQVELASRSSVHPSNLNKIERGKTVPGLRTLNRIASALGVGIGDIRLDVERATSGQVSV